MNIETSIIWIYILLPALGFSTPITEIELAPVHQTPSNILMHSSSSSPPSFLDDQQKIGNTIGGDIESGIDQEFFFWKPHAPKHIQPIKHHLDPPPHSKSIKNMFRTCIFIWVSREFYAYLNMAEQVLQTSNNQQITQLASKTIQTGKGFSCTDYLDKTSSQVMDLVQDAILVLQSNSLAVRERCWALGLLKWLQKHMPPDVPFYIGSLKTKESVTRGELELSLIGGMSLVLFCGLLYTRETHTWGGVCTDRKMLTDEIKDLWRYSPNPRPNSGECHNSMIFNFI